MIDFSTLDGRMKELSRCMSNDLRGLNWIEDKDLYGFRIKDGGWTLYTAYATETGFSSYVAIPDIHKGIDCADEKLLVANGTLFACVNAIRKHHAETNPGLYRGLIGTDEAYRNGTYD